MMIRPLLLRSSASLLALTGVVLLLAPARDSYGFSKIGGSLNVGTQRDFRVFNNFADATANDNLAENPMYPGWYGADRALWKAAAEWGSEPHGDGTGDPNQPIVGDGGGNFDFFFAGAATGPGGSNRNIASAIPGCGGGTLAYVISPISNGWTMRFCENRIWSDGPGGPGFGRFDLQGVGCHEFGHALGLGHSNVSGATMVGSTANGLPQRSITADDISGLQCIYNAKDPAKLRIDGVQYNAFFGQLTIDGVGFDDTTNEVWFTQALATAAGQAGPQVVVTGVTSTNGGTRIVVNVPPAAGSGQVAVKSTVLTGGKSLSNPYPVDLLRGGGALPLALSSVDPAVVDALQPGTMQTVTLGGSGFDAGVVVTVNDVALPGASYTVVDEATITLDLPQLSSLGTQTIGIQKGTEAVATSIDVVAPQEPTLQVGTGDPLNPVAGSVDLLIAGPVGENEVVLYGFSDDPSILLPYVALDIGSDFTDLFLLSFHTIPAAGWTQTSFPLQSTTIDLYLQALTLERGLPVPVSNLQSISILP